ncbi:MAG: thioredoxin family protein [Bacillota bacterium]|jgi:small redox-active disulfide protein 2
MQIKVLGTGCAKCKRLYSLTKEVVQELGTNDEVIYVNDMAEIMNAGVMRTPALTVDGEIKVSGRLPKKDELRQLLSTAK